MCVTTYMYTPVQPKVHGTYTPEKHSAKNQVENSFAASITCMK